MLIHREELRVFADYHQFYLWDGVISPDAPESYTDEDVTRRNKTAEYVVVIQPERDLEVPVTIEIHDQEPPCELTSWDHVAEASLSLPNGALQVHECTGGPVTTINVAPGSYRVRSCHSGLGTLRDHGMEGDDRYLITVWPAPFEGVRVLKQWPGA